MNFGNNLKLLFSYDNKVCLEAYETLHWKSIIKNICIVVTTSTVDGVRQVRQDKSEIFYIHNSFHYLYKFIIILILEETVVYRNWLKISKPIIDLNAIEEDFLFLSLNCVCIHYWLSISTAAKPLPIIIHLGMNVIINVNIMPMLPITEYIKNI